MLLTGISKILSYPKHLIVANESKITLLLTVISQIWTYRHDADIFRFSVIYSLLFFSLYLSVNPLRNHRKKSSYDSRTCLRMIMFLSFLQRQSNPVMAGCASMGALQTGTTNSYFNILPMVPVSQYVNKYRLKKYSTGLKLLPKC